jgi:hypothetical protein
MVLSTVSTSDLAVVTSGLPRPVVAPVPGVPGAGGASQGATSVKAVGTGPRLGDDVGSLLRHLVIHGAGVSVPGSVALGDVAPAPVSSSVADPVVSGQYMLGSPVFLPPPTNWRWVGG